MALFGSPKWHSYVNIPVRLCFYTDRLMATASVRLSSFGLRQDDPVGDVGRLFAKTIRWLILADLVRSGIYNKLPINRPWRPLC